jgi:hypothetical protein
MNMLVRKPHPMPEMAAFVAELRSAFGDTIDEAIARGNAGEPTFFATENGLTVGTRAVDNTTHGWQTTLWETGDIVSDATGNASEPARGAVNGGNSPTDACALLWN